MLVKAGCRCGGRRLRQRARPAAALLSTLAEAEDAARALFRVKLRPLQRAAVAASLRGDSFLFISPTASGKSLCFQLPAAVAPDGLTTLVVSPLLALMHEQVLRLRRLGIDAIELHGGSLATRLEGAAGRGGPPRLVYTTPEWLARHHNELVEEGIKVGRLVVDEAHCISEWGAASGFRSDYLQLGVARSSLAAQAGLDLLPVSCFTATATEQVRRDIIEHLQLPPLERAELFPPTPDLRQLDHSEVDDEQQYYEGGAGRTLLFEAEADRPNLELVVRQTAAAGSAAAAGSGSSHVVMGERELLSAIGEEILRQDGGRAIVFCITRPDAERVASGLARLPLTAGGGYGMRRAPAAAGEGGAVGVFHSGLSEAARRKAARQWARGVTRVLVATPAVGLGLDSPDVTLVVHHTLPPSLASYWQQAGRAGRDGRPARCVLFYNPADVARVRTVLQTDTPGWGTLPRSRAELAAVEKFCTTTERCRREVLFEYLGGEVHAEGGETGCGNCDVCMGRRLLLAAKESDQNVAETSVVAEAAAEGLGWDSGEMEDDISGERYSSIFTPFYSTLLNFRFNFQVVGRIKRPNAWIGRSGTRRRGHGGRSSGQPSGGRKRSK